MKKEYTFIYSSNSISALESMINEFSDAFGLDVSASDLFYYGVFCKPETYVCFKGWDSVVDNLDVPLKLLSLGQSMSSKIDYVNSVINSVLYGEIEKPEWMEYVELNEDSDHYGREPSTYLYVRPKDSAYESLSVSIVDFLYSVNMISLYVNK